MNKTDFEMEKCLIMDILDHVVHYFCSAHLSDIMSKYKDNATHKERSVSIRHKLLSCIKKQELCKTEIKYPCSKCGQAYIEVDSVTDPQFEDFSVGCDGCQKWFHYICLSLNGKEPEL